MMRPRLFNVLILLQLAVIGCARTTITSLDDPMLAPSLAEFKVIQVVYQPQTVSTLCGLASLACLFEKWEVRASQADLLSSYPPAQIEYGYTLGELRQIAQQNELQGFCIRGSVAFLEQQLAKGRPILVALKDSRETEKPIAHAVVVCGYSDAELLIMDPRGGFLVIPKKELVNSWEQTNFACLIVSR